MPFNPRPSHVTNISYNELAESRELNQIVFLEEVVKQKVRIKSISQALGFLNGSTNLISLPCDDKYDYGIGGKIQREDLRPIETHIREQIEANWHYIESGHRLPVEDHVAKRPKPPSGLIINEGQRMKRSYLNPETNEYNTEVLADPKKSPQSFDSIIMECQDMLSVETEVKKRYEEWLGKGIKSKLNISVADMGKGGIKSASIFTILFFISLPSLWFISGPPLIAINTVVSVLSLSAALSGWIVYSKYLNIKYIKQEPKQKPSESSKFQFLKESYSGTIENLNIKLDEIKRKIHNQIEAHTKDKESLLELAEMFTETDFMVKRIDKAILALQSSYKKVSEKKAEITKALNEYVGENGYIAEKEREIERLKVAQELSERMQKNFHSTLEITKSVDVLTDTIIPGIKQLMSLKIPELIDKVNYECDKEKAFLDIAK